MEIAHNDISALENELKNGGKHAVNIVAKTPGASDAHVRVPENLHSRSEDGKNFVKRHIHGILTGIERYGEDTILAIETERTVQGGVFTSYVLVNDIISLSTQKI